MAIHARRVALAVEVRPVDLSPGRVLQVDIVCVCVEGTLRLISVHVNPAWPRPVLREVFEVLRTATSAQGVVAFAAGDYNSIVGTEVRFSAWCRGGSAR